MIPVLAVEALGQIATAVFSGGNSRPLAGPFQVSHPASTAGAPPANLGRLAHTMHGALLGLQETTPGTAIQADDIASRRIQPG